MWAICIYCFRLIINSFTKIELYLWAICEAFMKRMASLWLSFRYSPIIRWHDKKKTSSAKSLLCFCRWLHNILSLHIETKDINMASFRKEILGQIERIDTGRIFRFRDLSFETEKTVWNIIFFCTFASAENKRKSTI